MSLPATFGDVTAEYRAARSEMGAVPDLYDLVWFGGPDAVRFLNDLITQNVAAMQPGSVARSLLLGPRGKLVALLWVMRGTDRVGLLTEAGQGDVVADTLGRYRIRVDVTIEREERRLTALVGPDVDEFAGWTDDAHLVAAVPLPGSRRLVTTAPTDLPMVGRLAWTAIRVEAGEPLMGVDVDEKTIPQETGLVAVSVDFTKGCFLGQELVGRIDSRGRVNRHLRGVRVGTNVLPPPGAEVTDAAGKTVGTFTSPAESLTLRAPVGLALVRHEVGPGDPVTLRWEGGQGPAVLDELPMVG